MRTTHFVKDNICTVCVGEGGFLEDASEFKKYMRQLCEKERMTGLVINLKHVPMLNSSGLGEIVFLYRKMENEHISFALCELNAHIQQLFSISNFDKVIQIYPTQEEAIKGVSKKPLVKPQKQLQTAV